MSQRNRVRGDSAQDILRAISLLYHPGTIAEIRVLGSGRGVVSGYYDNIDDLARAADRYSAKGTGVYWTLNPCRPELLTRGMNRLREFTPRGETTSDEEIVERRWLLVDVDAQRPAGISATDKEHQAALDLARQVERYLCDEHGFPHPVLIDSGNGAYLLYQVQLPNNPASETLVREFLRAIDLCLRLTATDTTTKAKIDTSVYNAARLIRVPGTMNRKGDSTPERPHRQVTVLQIPEALAPVPVDLIRSVTALGICDAPTKTASKTLVARNGQTADGVHDEVGRNGGAKELKPYAEAALRRELSALASAGPGHRNNQLNRSAFALGQLVGAGLLDRSVAECELDQAGRSIGLESTEIGATIRSGIESGMLRPRDIPTLSKTAGNGRVDGASPPPARDATTNQTANPPQERRTVFKASELLELQMKEPTWAIPGILPEGLSLLGGKPKLGKSWMGLGFAVAVATGGRVLGKIPVDQGDVLYLGLEDNPRRLQTRLRKVLGEHEGARAEAPEGLANITLATEWPRLDSTCLTMLGGWLTLHPNARLIVIDTLARIKARRRGNGGSSYDEDYASVEGLQRLASQHNVAILVVTHLRKADADDPLDLLNATLGLSGAADAILILKRDRGKFNATLYVSGRDVEEKELALTFDADIATWVVVGDAAEYQQSKERQEINDVLRKANEPLPPKEVAELLGKKHSAVKKLMWEMSKDGDLKADDGKYSPKAS